MSNLKITIDQIKNYLGTGLEIRVVRKPSFRNQPDIISIKEFSVKDFDVLFKKRYGVKEAKPLMYRLSDLDKHIPELGFVPIEEFDRIAKERTNGNESIGISGGAIEVSSIMSYRLLTLNHTPYWILQKLFQWNLWPFGDEYFNEGLVIDKLKHVKEASND